MQDTPVSNKACFGRLKKNVNLCYNAAMNAYLITGLIGIALAVIVVFLLRQKTQLSARHLIYMVLCGGAGIFVGGHLLFFLVGLPDFIRDEVPNIHSGAELFDRIFYASSGMVFYGGLLCALLFCFLYVKIQKLPGRFYLNNVVPAFPLFHVCGRIGCALTGCCYGVEYHGPLAMRYTHAHITEGINDALADFPRFPVQPLEAFLELCIFGILLLLFFKKGNAFSATSTYLLLYSVVRFLDEFLRGDELRGFWGPFSTSQWISLAIFVVTIIYLLRKRKKEKELLQS